MRKYLISTVLLLSTSLLAATHAHDNRQQDCHILHTVFGMVSAKDLQNLRVSGSQIKKAVEHYQPYVLPRLVERASSSSSHQAVADDIAIIGLRRTKEQTEAAIHNAIATHLNANPFISVEMGCPLSSYLVTHPDLSQINIADFGAYPDVFSQMQLMYARIFKESMPEEEAAKRHALDAFAAVFPVKDVYFSKENLEVNILSYLEALLPLQETYRTLLTNEPFDQTSHIVISDSQIQDQTTQAKLKTILTANPKHTVVLTVGNSTDTVNAQGKLSSQIVTDFVKNMGIKYLHLINPRGNVKMIGGNFLCDCEKLINVDMRGFENVQSIGDNFLSDCYTLTRFNTRTFKNVRSIGNRFLYVSALTNFDSLGLENLQSIKNDFLSNCFALTNFDSRDLTRLQSIGDNFLYSCHDLISIDTQNLIRLQCIGNRFLSCCHALTVFNLQNLTHLRSIGYHFLFGCHTLTLTISNIENFTHLQSIGNQSFFGCSLISTDIMTQLRDRIAQNNTQHKKVE